MNVSDTNEILLETRGLGLSYKGCEPLFSDVRFELRSGEIVGIMGESGCGKTSFCYCLTGIIPASRKGELTGEVLFRGKSIRGRGLCENAQNTGFVFQDPDIQLFSDSIEEDIVFGLETLCLPRDEIRRRLYNTTELLGISGLLGASPHELSCGQRQLAAIASVLVMQPRAIILDEAFSALDEKGKKTVREAVLHLRDSGHGILMVEHRLDNISFADRILTMKRGVGF